MRKVIIFDIKNIQEDYVKCSQFMWQIGKKKKIKLVEDICSGWIECEAENDAYGIARKIESVKWLQSNTFECDKSEDLLWCFRINVEEEDDIVNLMYYYLIKQRQKNVLAILITPGIEYDMKISAYLSFEIKKDRNTMFIKTTAQEIETYGVVHRLAGTSLKAREKKEIKLTRFLPLIEVTYETYDFLSGTVETAQKVLNNSSSNYIWEKTVLHTCNGLFTQYNKAKGENFVQSKDYLNAINNVTVLAYILFCAFRNHCSDRRHIFEIAKIEQELSDARDIAEGVLQILENIILHSQNKEGYFSFRIHDKRRSKYLGKIYTEYINKNVNDTFLEMFIADHYILEKNDESENILCKQFVANLRNRSILDRTIKPFIRKYENLEVKQFFDNEIWSEYNAVSDNIIEHYGLQLFDKIVSSCNGCFELISSTGYKCSKEQCYSSIGNDKKESRCVLPGTQYKVLLPITERSFGQGYPGIDFYDYPKTIMLKPILDEINSTDIDFSKIIKEVNKKIKSKIQGGHDKKEQNKELKAQLTFELSKRIFEELKKSVLNVQQYVVHFILDEIKGAGLVEIIFKSVMKALIRLRNNIGNEKKIYIAFGKLSKEFITEFCYLMGIYYYKAEESQIMKNTEMYFWDIGYYEDLLISGENLHIVHNAIIEKAVLRGIYPRWLNFLDYVWEKYDNYHKSCQNKKAVITTLPYDVIIKNEEKTIFENIVKKVLERPFANRELGCLIENTHVQLASKIHISKFYNGQILFLNNYFTNYFSYLVVKKISKYIQKKDYFQNITLVGYESYSEMLLVETSELLKSYISEKRLNYCFDVQPYIIGELIGRKLILRSAEGHFDNKNISICEKYKNSLFVFIVPINSTMLTLERIHSELEKILGIEINSQNNIANYALILIRDVYKEKYEEKNSNININYFMTEEEQEYWKEKEYYNITTRNKDLSIDYFIEVYGNWERASKCQYCFPKSSICEKPLIKTDVTGLSPLTQLGQKKKWKQENSSSTKNLKRLRRLSNVLTYNHIERGGNHYLYYFDTAAFFYKNQDEINSWLKNIIIEEKNKSCYAFIVSPLHATNAGFTEEINKTLFNNTAHIIRLDFCKTYRSNFMQQFSYIKILYQNIMQTSIRRNKLKTEINFYFVDDEVISGKTLIRAKSLIEGLFEHFPESEHIVVNVFKKIFVLINRLSDASKHNYIHEVENFKSYVDFNVSPIQNHDDFCFMCKLVNRANHYKYMSATNQMDKAWGQIEDKFKIKNYTWAEQNQEYKQDKYKNRMLAAHYSEAAMWNLSENATPKEYFQVMVKKLFYVRLYKRNEVILLSENNKEIFISLIKTLSRPFFVYRKNAKEAALHLLIAFCECFLGTDYTYLWNELNKAIFIQQLDIKKEVDALFTFMTNWQQEMDDSAYNLLLDLLEQLADMESGYIVRRKNIIKIFKVYKLLADKKYGKDTELKGNELKQKFDAQKKFEYSYALFIKQITNEDADEIKSLWIENLFCLGTELNFVEKDESEDFNNFCGYKTEFGRNVLIENTKIIYDSIKYLGDSINEEKWRFYQKEILEQNYNPNEIKENIKNEIREICKQVFNTQLESLKKILYYYQMEQDIEKITLEVLYYGLMFNITTERIPFENFYKEFYLLIKEITGADVQLLMIPNHNDINNELFYNDAPCIIYDSRIEANSGREIKLQDKPLVDSEYLRKLSYEGETYYIKEDKKQVIIKYIINLKHKEEKDSIYLILQYSNSQEIKNIIFNLRLILLCRSRTITRMKRDFNNNLFQSLWQTKKHNMLLEHFKNASHMNPVEDDMTSKTINYIWRIDKDYRKTKEKMEMGLRIYKAILLKMLADNNISSIYHEILANRLVSNFVRAEKFTAGGIFSDIKDLRYILKKSGNTKNSEWLQDIENQFPEIMIDQNVLEGYMYYIAPNSFRTQLLVISLIQNAYKHGNNMKPVRIYRETEIQTNKNKLDYLCISNGIDIDNIELLKDRIDEHIKKPVTARKINDDRDNSEGITLFSLNRYCQKIAEELEIDGSMEDLMKYEIKDNEIIFKALILKGDD